MEHPAMRCLFCLGLLLWSTAAAGATAPTDVAKKVGGQARHQSDRLIVRFADPHGRLAERELLERKVGELAARAGVRHAKAYAHVGMAVAACDSFEVVERLMQELESDPTVELATPDTVVSLFDDGSASRGHERRSFAQSPLEEDRQCSAQPRCAGLAGKCCPAADGMMLACCEPSKHNVVAFRSSHGKFMVAEESGAANANREKMDAWEKFRYYTNDDGTISLLSHFGKYLSASDGGRVNSNSPLIGRHEKFHLIRNSDSTVSLKTTGLPGKYLRADSEGHLSADSRVINATEKFNMIHVDAGLQLIPNDANFSALWGMDDPIHDKDIDAPEAWKKFQGSPSSGVVVAIIDTGIDYTHEDLRDAMWTNPNEIPGNGIDDDGNGYIDDVHGADFANEDGDPMDDQMHGTHCAGTIAGMGDNGKGVAGVSWRGARLMALKFLTSTGSGRTSDAVKALDYAVAHGAKIASNSWGGASSSAALRIAIERAEAAGVLFVAAAGNSGTDNDEEPQFPANYPSANVVAVASTDPEGKLSVFSCYGAERVDVAAPGSSIFSTVPRNGYKFLSGTSMATPHVSGLAALVWMYRPKLSMQQVKDIVLSTVVHSDTLEGKILTGGRINARKALEAASLAEPPYPPQHAPLAVAFRDVDPKVGVLKGTVTISAAADESDVEYYKVYFVSRAGFQLDAIGNATATGAKSLALHLVATYMPDNAASIVAVAGNASGEQPARLGAGVPSAKLEDYGVPDMGPAAAEWHGDEDLRPGMVSGKLSIKRATDERTITSYNVYWSNSSTDHGPLVGTIPAVGFQGPQCTGAACSLINATKTAEGVRYDRSDYGNHEMAIITASGPGLVKVTRFHTEVFFDRLSVGDTDLFGRPPVPKEIPFSAGKLAIRWASDESTTNTGWTFEITQTETTAELRLQASKPLGRGLLVVPEYQATESPQGIFVELPDFTKSMPPSPGFAPLSVNFTDGDLVAGVVAGTAKVMPAPGAAGNGSVAYYQLDFADEDGTPIGQGLRADANGSYPVSIPISARALPPRASKVVVRAGNSLGLGEGRTSAALVDAVEARAGDGATSPLISQAAPLLEAKAAVQAGEAEVRAPPREREAEPWLGQPSARQDKRSVWPPSTPKLLGAGVPGSRVLSSVVVHGLGAEAATTPALRAAFEQAVAEALPGVGRADIQVSRIFALSRGGVEVEFKVGLPHGALAPALDRIESRIILFSLGGSSAKRFERGLLAALVGAGAELPEGARASVAAPRQVSPRRAGGRKLAAGASARRLQSGSASAVLAEAGASAGRAAVAGYALLSALGALVAAFVAGRRPCGRRCPGATPVGAATELESGLQ